MVIRLLGDVVIRAADGVSWQRAGPAKQAAVLAVLALSPNRPVPQETLIHRVWGTEPPPSVRSALYAHIARLRKALVVHDDVRLERGRRGYQLEIPVEKVDLFAARDKVSRARAAVDLGEHRGAAGLYREVIASWTSAPVGNIDGPWAERTRETLRREHLGILEATFEASLEAGTHTEVIDDITAAWSAYPASETLASQLMLALYRGGRQADALETFARAEKRLRESFGLDPGPGLREIHRQVLRHDPGLEQSSPSSAATVAPQERVPRQLPPVSAGFSGRESSLDRLDACVDGPRDPETGNVAVITGMAGVGKTALAVRWAHQVSERFPDGQLFADLRGFSVENPLDPSDVLAGFLRALGVPGNDIPDDPTQRAALYRTHTANRRLLVVLDNATEVSQVFPLLPTARDSTAVITSRHSLAGMVALYGARRIHLDILDGNDSVDLLRGLLPSVPSEALERLSAACSGLPLALRIAAANVEETGEIDEYLDALEARRLGELSVKEEPLVAVRHTFELSYRRLDESARRAFRLLAVTPGADFSSRAAAAMLGMSPERAKSVLRQLTTVHLLRQPGSERFAYHDLLSEFASELDDAHRPEATVRLRSWYTHSARSAAEALSATALQLPTSSSSAGLFLADIVDHSQAMSWFAAERDNIMWVIRQCAPQGDESCWLLAEALRLYVNRTGDYPGLHESASLGLEAARLVKDAAAECGMYYLLSMHAQITGHKDEAVTMLSAALVASHRAGDDTQSATLHASMANLQQRRGQLDAAVRHCDHAMDTVEEFTPRQRMIVWNTLGITYREMGRLDQSRDILARHVETLRGDKGHKLAPTLGALALTHLDAGELDRAADCAERALRLAESDVSMEQVSNSDNLARVYVARGWRAQARAYAERALRLAKTHGDRLSEAPAWVTLAWCVMDVPGEAIGAATTALDAARQLDLPSLEVEAAIALGAAHRGAGSLDDAERLAEMARQQAGNHGYEVLRARADLLLAGVYVAAGRAAEAADLARTAASSCASIGHRPGESVAADLLRQLPFAVPEVVHDGQCAA